MYRIYRRTVQLPDRRSVLPLPDSRAGRRPAGDQIPLRYPARKQVAHQLGNQLAASSRASSHGRRGREPGRRQAQAISTCRDGSNLYGPPLRSVCTGAFFDTRTYGPSSS